jgi:hypothetical protein
MAIGMGECREKVRGQMVEVSSEFSGWRHKDTEGADRGQKMIQPVGKPPEVQD